VEGRRWSATCLNPPTASEIKMCLCSWHKDTNTRIFVPDGSTIGMLRWSEDLVATQRVWKKGFHTFLSASTSAWKSLHQAERVGKEAATIGQTLTSANMCHFSQIRMTGSARHSGSHL
jgi:hypothetical protein